jgi:2-oxoglutarate dehydrogenase E1 component
MAAFSDKTRYDQNSLFSGDNQDYILALYKQYKEQSNTVSSDWQEWFRNFPLIGIEQEQVPTWPSANPSKALYSAPTNQNLQGALAAAQLIQAYRQWGHMLAKLDPLELNKPTRIAALKPEKYRLNNPNQQVWVNDFNRSVTVKELLNHLDKIYAQTIGLEFAYIEDHAERDWLQNRFEQRTINFSHQQKVTFFEHLQKIELFEQFLQTKFPGAKRFSIEGNDSLIPALENSLNHISQNGTTHAVVGMAHRGRLSVMANILYKPITLIFADFHDHSVRDDFSGSGDVKYHQGYSAKRTFDNQTLDISILNNASHLESVFPIALGKTRFLQDQNENAISILIHGDASFMGQGMVAESLQLSCLNGYQVGGSLHIILNNQIGFTATPQETRSTHYCSDIAKASNCPVIHVNADDVESVVWVFQFALEYRYQFNKDIVIDLVGYRRYGHNEGDEPRYTQPKMYQAIDDKPTVAKLYGENLKQENILNPERERELKQSYSQILQQSLEKKVEWPAYPTQASADPLSDFSLKALKPLALQTVKIPESLQLNSKLERIITNRRENIENEAPLDWSTAESLAFASLLHQGHSIRLAGQDSKRGTFSQRHAEWVDVKTDRSYIPLNNLFEDQANFECINTLLSEVAAMGFEYGYSLALKGLAIWEAQFGDFVNGAQVIIDQYLSASYSKWAQSSNLVLLLPHGHEGQGPEHTSSRLERFLQLSAEDNWRVTVCSTPANFYHLLRLQAESHIPLIALTPKSLLRHPLAVSSWQDFAPKVGFQAVLKDETILAAQVQRVILCSGKVYYDLETYRQQHNLQNVAIIRLEQLYPFPETELRTMLKNCSAKTWIWCQEEPQNMGAWSFVQPLLKDINPNFTYIGRPAAASPATGFSGRHDFEQQQLIEQAF